MAKTTKHKKRARSGGAGYGSYSKHPPMDKKDKIVIISIIAIIVLICIALTVLLITSPWGKKDKIPNEPEAIAREFADAYCSIDAERMLACYPSAIWKNDESEKTILLDSLQSFLNEAESYSESSFAIDEIVVPGDEQLAQTKKELEGYAKIIDGLDLEKITDYRYVHISIMRKTQLGEEYTDTETLTLINYDGKWCVIFPYLL